MMEKTDSIVQEPVQRPPRRVGTLTMGVVLVAAGIIMLVSMFFPQFDYTWALKLSPLILISLGAETLFAARKRERIRYDWVGMLLCCLIVCTALGLFCVAWCLVNHPAYLPF